MSGQVLSLTITGKLHSASISRPCAPAANTWHVAPCVDSRLDKCQLVGGILASNAVVSGDADRNTCAWTQVDSISDVDVHTKAHGISVVVYVKQDVDGMQCERGCGSTDGWT